MRSLEVEETWNHARWEKSGASHDHWSGMLERRAYLEGGGEEVRW
jgi:hypothetical protein